MQGGLKEIAKTVLSSKSGLIGLIIILMILGLSIVALIYVPFDVVSKWNDPTFWQKNPRTVAPEWFSLFLGKKLPPTIKVTPEAFSEYDYFVELSGLKHIILEARFNYDYDDFPSEIAAIIYANYSKNKPLSTLKVIRPDGLEVILCKSMLENSSNFFYISSDNEIKRYVSDFLMSINVSNTRVVYPEICLFAVKDEQMWNPNYADVLKGTYKIRIEIVTYDKSDTAQAEFILYGKVHGLAGTDSKRRDLFIGLVWGAPVALAFGLSAAIVTSLIQSLLGSISAWYGGVIDEIIQRITEVYLILPFLPFLITISVVYRIDLWTLLLVVVILSILGGVTKTARSVTLQVISEQYIEAAISYGASKIRILFLYIMPRLLPYIVANIVLSVPAYVFLEAALSVLGLGDPMVPTWGKIISDAYAGGATVHGFWWWILLPALLIIITASAFALLGYSLDKIVNPKLRER